MEKTYAAMLQKQLLGEWDYFLEAYDIKPLSPKPTTYISISPKDELVLLINLKLKQHKTKYIEFHISIIGDWKNKISYQIDSISFQKDYYDTHFFFHRLKTDLEYYNNLAKEYK